MRAQVSYFTHTRDPLKKAACKFYATMMICDKRKQTICGKNFPRKTALLVIIVVVVVTRRTHTKNVTETPGNALVATFRTDSSS